MSRKDSGYEIISAFPVKDELLKNGNEFEVKKRLDILVFVEQSGNLYDLSEIQSKQRNRLKEICKLLQSADILIFLGISTSPLVKRKLAILYAVMFLLYRLTEFYEGILLI